MQVSIILSAGVDRMTKVEGEDVTRLAQEVGTALQRILAESPQMSHCLNRVRAEGYEVSLVLEATIGFSRTEGNEPVPEATFDVRVEKAEPAPLKMTPLDKKFLRSLKITVDEEDD
jgi:predicted alternative tryptophan synthase beta-subunit